MENLSDKNEKATSGSVAIEGVTIKTVRETKKLTQLYVASVVGVTTDTISRWENNRYPTIKRENAEKLAMALEVNLDEILRHETACPSEEVVENELPQPKKKNWRGLLLAILIIALIIIAAFFILSNMSSPVAAVRWIPKYSAPGELMPVQITVNRMDNTSRGLIIKEKLPPGWRLVNAMPPAASGKAPSEEIKWLIPGGSGAVRISYVVQLPQDAALDTRAELHGTIFVHTGSINRAEAIKGNDRVTIAPLHWADSNGDSRIDDSEIMPAYYITEEMKSLALDWSGIEAIWSGSGYSWDQTRKEFKVTK